MSDWCTVMSTDESYRRVVWRVFGFGGGSRIRSIRCADSVRGVAGAPSRLGPRVLCDAGGGVNVELAEDATDRGTPRGERALSFEVLVGLAAVVAAIIGGKES